MNLTKEEVHKMALEIEKALQEAVKEELIKKAKLGQYAIVNLGDDKPHRILASELIKDDWNISNAK